MAKGPKLMQLLADQKAKEKFEKEEELKNGKKAAKLVKDEFTVVSKEDLKQKEKAQVKAAEKKDAEEYKSEALSKKEKRKLKKAMKQMDKEEDDKEEEEEKELNFDKLAKSDSESEDESEVEEEKEEEQEEEEDVPLSEVEFDSDADVVPHHKLTINNTRALKHALTRVKLPWEKYSFQEHQSVTSKVEADASIKDIYDDTERELAFYKQSLDAVLEARDHLKRLKVPFLRPLDYFAEMVKSDEHMDKLKGKLVREASEKKAREEARKQRQLKKFGKQVQVATLQKRQLEKKETLDKIKNLKKKRKQSEISTDDFDIGIEEAIDEPRYGKPSGKRAAKNAKYGKGGMKRFKRKNDADSSADVSGFSQRKMKGKPSRPGKHRRAKRY